MVQNHMPDDPCVPASAESEWWLCRARRNKQVRAASHGTGRAFLLFFDEERFAPPSAFRRALSSGVARVPA